MTFQTQKLEISKKFFEYISPLFQEKTVLIAEMDRSRNSADPTYRVYIIISFLQIVTCIWKKLVHALICAN